MKQCSTTLICAKGKNTSLGNSINAPMSVPHKTIQIAGKIAYETF